VTAAELAALVAALRGAGAYHPAGATYAVPIHPTWFVTPARRGALWALCERLAALEADAP